jgi:hypothetical protein
LQLLINLGDAAAIVDRGKASSERFSVICDHAMRVAAWQADYRSALASIIVLFSFLRTSTACVT